MEERFDALERKIDLAVTARHKSMEWIATLAEQMESVEDFRQEVRSTFEPIVNKLDNVDELIRILRHATSDVSRRIERIERRSPRRPIAHAT
jgi:hypothetical protein